jgi:septum formation protein
MSAAAAALLLASGSRYRRQQLLNLGLSIECDAADIDESPLALESPAHMAQRLARTKAEVVASRHPGACIIAADQVAALDQQILGKPGSAAAQAQQLQFSSNRELRFHTALTVIGPDRGVHEHLDLTSCRMRTLDDDVVARYVAAEPAYDCAGGFKVEGLGITLFERIDSQDPSALIGLPLIAVCRILRQLGWDLP